MKVCGESVRNTAVLPVPATAAVLDDLVAVVVWLCGAALEVHEEEVKVGRLVAFVLEVHGEVVKVGRLVAFCNVSSSSRLLTRDSVGSEGSRDIGGRLCDNRS